MILASCTCDKVSRSTGPLREPHILKGRARTSLFCDGTPSPNTTKLNFPTFPQVTCDTSPHYRKPDRKVKKQGKS